MKRKLLVGLFVSLLSFLSAFPAFSHDGQDRDYHGKGNSGAVFIMTNNADGNVILMYQRSGNGRIEYQDFYPTGGVGAGVGKTIPIDPLGSQNSLLMSEDGKYLYAVNAGDDTISVFEVKKNYLKFLDIVSSGGRFPVSLTVHQKILYVLNAGAMDKDGNGTRSNITGFKLTGHLLIPLKGSTRDLVEVP